MKLYKKEAGQFEELTDGDIALIRFRAREVIQDEIQILREEYKELNRSLTAIKDHINNLTKELDNVIKAFHELNTNFSHYIPEIAAKNKEISRLQKQIEFHDTINIITQDGSKLIQKKKLEQLEKEKNKYLLWIDERNDSVWFSGTIFKISQIPRHLLITLVAQPKSLVSYSVLFDLHKITYPTSSRYFKDTKNDRALIHRWIGRLLFESKGKLSPYIKCINRCKSRQGDNSGYFFNSQDRKFCIIHKK